MSEKIEDVLAQCIDDITAGRASLGEVLGQHPSLRNELEPLLQMALGLRETSSQVKPSPDFTSRTKAQVMEAISAGGPAPRRGFLHFPLGNNWKGERRNSMVFKIATATAALVLVLGIGGGTVYAAQDAQFGDPLYPVKLATERARLAFSSDKTSTHLDIAETRLDELTNATLAGEADATGRLAAQYRSHVMEALTLAAQASENRSERATERLQEKLELHQMAMEALADEMPETVQGTGQGQAKGPGKPDDVGKPEHAGQPAGVATADDDNGEDNGDVAKRAGQAATDGCFYMKTGNRDRYQVWCSGIHLIVNLDEAVEEDIDDIIDWLEDSLDDAQAAVEDGDATDVINTLRGKPGVQHLNFYGPLSKLNQYKPDLGTEEQE